MALGSFVFCCPSSTGGGRKRKEKKLSTSLQIVMLTETGSSMPHASVKVCDILFIAMGGALLCV